MATSHPCGAKAICIRAGMSGRRHAPVSAPPRNRRPGPVPRSPAGTRRDYRCVPYALPDRPAGVLGRGRPICHRWRSAASAARSAASSAWRGGRPTGDRPPSSIRDWDQSARASSEPPNRAWVAPPRAKHSCCHPRLRRNLSPAAGCRFGRAPPTAAGASPSASSMPADFGSAFVERAASARRRAAGSSSRRCAISFAAAMPARLCGGSSRRRVALGRTSRLATNRTSTIVLRTETVQPRYPRTTERRLVGSKKTG